MSLFSGIGVSGVPETSVDDEYDHFYYEDDEGLTGVDEMGPPPLLSGPLGEEVDYYHHDGPVPLPDDVPADFLVGRMNLKVILPSGQCVRMSVERR